MPFPSSPTNGQTAVVNSITYSYSTSSNSWTRVSVSAGSAGTAATATQVQTIATPTNASFYITFVDANNSSAAGESVYTTSSFIINPSSGQVQATSFNSTSDISLKENIEKTQNATEIIKQIDGVAFTWKKTKIKSYGVIAQDIEKIIPEAVSEDGGIKSVNYNAIIAFLIEANKELADKVDQLEKKLQ